MAESATQRERTLGRIAELLVAIRRPHPVRVAIDGVDAAGKTTLADALAPLIEARGRPAIRATLNGFHRPRAARYRRGAESPEGYHHDSFDSLALRAALLNPLGPGGDRRYRAAAFDYRADGVVAPPTREAAPDAILLLDGVFLLRPELMAIWDTHIFVAIGFAEMLRRAVTRDRDLFGSEEAVRARYERRYLPAQRLYLATERPEERAAIVVDNTDPELPVLVRAGEARRPD